MATITLDRLREVVLKHCIRQLNDEEVLSICDFMQGVNDCFAGVHNAWYQGNREDKGASYNKGWQVEAEIIQPMKIDYVCLKGE